ncbi:restriction endonuclease subunit S [Patescibacteria group bacterium]|nr:restriction endonuclease subunit S [Patescibacteria group bacterium]MBU0879352.1 restriction endonuclease subunit S [Patescibacteria group bacterium]MBU0880025.1 restriction endonuclease subunit S [Patescibacteria group bacterium]MBU1062881.1 restriction endonuclease subunit S [Patescibacteria group bacterium]MBU1783209.1 restriction endonuclease subunit S [Patescibacteria group bacterium]
MAQISYIKYTDVLEARRYDAECFVVLSFLKNKYNLINSTDFSDKNYIEIIDGDRGKNYPNGDDFSSKGFCLFLNTSNVLSDGFNLENGQFITKNKDGILGGGKLKRNDIVFTTRGTIGNIGIYNEFIEYQNLRINSGMVIFRLKNINPSFFFIFLLSPYFKNQIKAYSSGSVQSQIPIQTIKKLKIPLFPQSFQLQIEQIVKSAHQKQTQSKKLYHEAEELLLAELGLLNYQVNHELTFSTTKKAIEQARRYDSEYFQPKYAEIIKKIENYAGGWDFAGEMVKWKKGVEVGTDAYTETGKDFVRVSDFTVFGLSESNRKISDEAFEGLKKNYQPKQGEILFTKDGTIGISYVLKEDIQGVLSGAFLRLTLKEKYQDFEKECLSLIFSSILCKMQVEKLSGGALIAHLKPSDFETFKIPLIKPLIQKQIALKIQESHRLRKESKDLLEEAKRKVEEEIEK